MKTKKPVLIAFWVYFSAIVLASLTSTATPAKNPEPSISVASAGSYLMTR